MIYSILFMTVTFLSVFGCSNSSSSDETVPSVESVAEDIATDGTVGSGDSQTAKKTPKTPKAPEVPKEPVDKGFDDLLNLNTRKAIDFAIDGQSITVPHNEKFDVWSNDSAYSIGFNIVQDASDGTQLVPIISRGQSIYAVKIDYTNEFIQIEGTDPITSHLSTVFFSSIPLNRAADGTVNLAFTITRSSLGVEKWYVGPKLIKTFNTNRVSSSSEAEPIIIGAAAGQSAAFKGKLDLVSLWEKELTMKEVVELVTEYDPREHSVYTTHAVSVWPLGEDLAVDGNDTGATVYDIRSGFHAQSVSMDENSFIEVDLTELEALVIDTYGPITNTLTNASDGLAVQGADVSIIGASTSYSATTDVDGNFTLSDLPKEPYAILIQHTGHTDYISAFDPTSTNYLALSEEIVEDGNSNFRVVATWDDDPIDIDLFCVIYNEYSIPIGMIHSLSPSFSNGDFSASLENNDTDSYGPESLSITNLPENYKFKILLANYSQGLSVDNNALITIYEGNTILAEYKLTDVVNPNSSNNNFFHVATYENSAINPELSYVSTP